MLVFLTFIASEINCLLTFTWRDSYSRGTSSLSYCVNPTPIKELDQMCYPPCNPTYTAVFSNNVCYGPCLWRYTDNGATCSDNGAYWRPAGAVSQSSCESTGNSNYNPTLGCHYWAIMWYMVCYPGYYESGGSVM